jgi:tetratricopeptide (TPR) repeat protein
VNDVIASGKQVVTLITGSCIILAAAFLLVTGQGRQILSRAMHPAQGDSRESAQRIPEKTVSSGPALPVSAVSARNQKISEAQRLNDEGVLLIQKNQLWEGLFLLEKAIRLDPANLAALLNMSTVLADMGLTAPADRYLEKAKAIDPQNLQLRENFPEALQSPPSNPIRMEGMFPSTEIIEPVVGKSGSVENGVRLWQDDMLHLWGIDDHEIYDLR